MWRPILDNQWKKWQVLLSLGLLFIHLFVFSISARPVQDDYSLLADISEAGLFSYLSLVWETHGGNLVPMLLNAGAISSSLHSFNFISLSLFSVLTFASVGLVIWMSSFQIRVQQRGLDSRNLLFLIIGTLFGFEGLFSPGLIGAYHFSSASSVHLWPILFTLVGIRLASSSSGNVLLIFLLGFLAGNSNIAESLAIIIATSLLIFFPHRFVFHYSKFRLGLFTFGATVGALAILASPGFWYRATEKTSDGIPGSLPEFMYRLAKSISIFTIDILTHPVLYIFFFLGFIFHRKFITSVRISSQLNYIEVLFSTLFTSLILGATFAYPAWHQTLGLLFLLPVTSFIIGARVGKKMVQFKQQVLSKVCNGIVFLLMILILRADYLVWSSGNSWGQTNATNICALQDDSDAVLANPEIHYPVFNLGIEDVQTWPWIRATYVRWVSNVQTISQIDCKLVD